MTEGSKLRRVAAVGAVLCLAALVLPVFSVDAFGATSRSQLRALESLAEASSTSVVARRGTTLAPRQFVTMRVPVSEFSDASSAVARGADFWAEFGAAFGVHDPDAELALHSVSTDAAGGTHWRYDQRYRGLEVFGQQLVLHADASGAVRAVNGAFEPGIAVSTTPAISQSGAVWTATQSVPARGVVNTLGGELLVFPDAFGTAHLAWRVTVATGRPLGLWKVFVDAHSGEVLRFHDDLHTARNRQTYTNNNDPDCNTQEAPACTLPGSLQKSEGGPVSANADIELTHANTGLAYDFYFNTFGRDSYDGAGHVMRSTVDFGGTGLGGFNNAFWCNDDCAAAYGSLVDGEQMVYGDGNGVLFSPLGRDPDVVVHELTHAVTESTSGLDYFGQSGALNESYSDVQAVMANPANWQIGEASFTPGTPGDALRDLSNPAAGGQPANMSQYVNTVFDNAGVHTNSGIPNHGAYLVSEGPGYGVGRAVTAQLYYWSLTQCLAPSSDFAEDLDCLLLASSFAPNIPNRVAARRAVARAHAAVGIAVPPEVTLPSGSVPTGAPATTAWSAEDMGVPFKVELLTEGAPTTYLQGFEASPSLPPEFTAAGSTPWIVDSTPPPGATGARAARAGAIGNDGRSEMSVVLRTNGGAGFSFRRRVDTEPGGDFYSLHVNGIPLFQRSGFADWSTQSLPFALDRGVYRFTFVYEKDFSIATGADTAWIDDITFTNMRTGASTVITPATAAGAPSQPFTATAAGTFRTRVTTTGVAPWLAEGESAPFTAVTSPPPLPPAPQPPPAPPAPPAPQPPPPPPPVKCKVPNLRGRTIAQARTALKAKHCKLGAVKSAFNAKVRKGRVISQTRRPGSTLAKNTAVGVKISKGARKKK